MSIIDISGLPAPVIIEQVSFAAIKARDIAKFKSLWEAVRDAYPQAGLPEYDVEMLETDPVVIALEAIAFSEMLLRDRVNVALKAILPAFARGTNLAAIVSRLGVIRASGETDAQLLERYLVALARPSAGSYLGYRSRVLEAWPGRGDVEIYGPDTHGRRGDIDIVLAAPQGAAVASGIINSVYSAVASKDAKPLTDVVSVRAATVRIYMVRHKLTVEEGRNAGPILAAAIAAMRSFVFERYAIGQSIPRSAILATGYVPGVIAVEDLTDGTNIDVAPDDVPWCAPDSAVIEVAT